MIQDVTNNQHEWFVVNTIQFRCFVAAVAAAMLSSCSEPPGGSDTSARAICEKFIVSSLRDPDSVQWVDSYKWPASLGDDKIWTVESKYRAKNGFGGLNSVQATCKVMHTDGSSWRLISLSVPQ